MRRLEEAYRQLKVENATLRTANDVRARAGYAHSDTEHGIAGSPSPSVPTGPRDRDRSRIASRTTTMTRTSSTRDITTSAGEPVPPVLEREASSGEAKWMLRLRDMEYKLKQEREGRNQDRSAARQRLGGLENENKELRGEVARIKGGKGGE